MLIAEYSLITPISPAAIWRYYQDVSLWPKWDHGLEEVRLNGPFQTGSSGTLKPVGGPLVHYKISSVIPNQYFQDISKLPLCRIIFTHTLTQYEGKTQLTHRIDMVGFLSPFFAFFIGRGIKKRPPHNHGNLSQAGRA